MSRILITGSNGGFGALTVRALLGHNHQVVAGMRDPIRKNKEASEEFTRLGAEVVALDVTQDQSVEVAVEAAIEKLGGLDCVIHNAGLGVLGIQEAFTPEDWRSLFEVNVFGVQRLNRAVLPRLRAQGSGLLVFVSSLLGRITMPFYGPYNASKWALEALAENSRWELSGKGVDCCLVEPGGFPTSFIPNLMKPSDPIRALGYGGFGSMAEGFLEGFEHALAANPDQDPRLVAGAIVELVEGEPGQRPFRTVVDRMGMGAAVEPLNEQQAQITEGLFRNFGLGHLLNTVVPGNL